MNVAEILRCKLLLSGYLVVVKVSVLRISKVDWHVRVTHTAVMMHLLHVVCLTRARNAI